MGNLVRCGVLETLAHGFLIDTDPCTTGVYASSTFWDTSQLKHCVAGVYENTAHFHFQSREFEALVVVLTLVVIQL